MSMTPFTLGGATTTISATVASAGGTFDASTGRIRVINAGPNTAFLRCGIGAQTAVATDVPILAGAIEVFSVPSNLTHAAAISPGGTATVYITSGTGA